jgi:hypothetical protein
MYLEAPKVAGCCWMTSLTGSETRLNMESHTEEEHALLEEVSKEFYDKVGGML